MGRSDHRKIDVPPAVVFDDIRGVYRSHVPVQRIDQRFPAHQVFRSVDQQARRVFERRMHHIIGISVSDDRRVGAVSRQHQPFGIYAAFGRFFGDGGVRRQQQTQDEQREQFAHERKILGKSDFFFTGRPQKRQTNLIKFVRNPSDFFGKFLDDAEIVEKFLGEDADYIVGRDSQ